MSKILLFSDSLLLPRNEPQKVLYMQTYAHLLREAGHYVVQCSIGGGTSSDLLAQSWYYTLFQPDFVVVQSGIVDCAPRALTRTEERILGCNRYISKLSRWILKPFLKSLRKIRHINYVGPKRYAKNIRELVGKFGEARVILISILPVDNGYEKVVPGITSRIEQYNCILKAVKEAVYLDMDNMPMEGIQPDHHHLNAIGHRYIADRILYEIRFYDNK